MSKQKQEIIPKVNTYYAIPTTAMLKFDGTEPFELVERIEPTIKGKHIFARLLVRYTGWNT